MSIRSTAVCWLLSVALGGPGAVAGSADLPAAPANLLLITVDTLRPDALGWVSGRGDTPEIDRLAAAGFRLPGAVSPVPLTLPAHASILSGLLPRRHGVRDNGRLLAAGVPLLSEHLRARGYSTGAFVSGFPLQRAFGLDRGFEHYDDTMPEGVEGWVERRAGGTVEAALEWLAKAEPPWFLWLHFYDPHDPYLPPRSFWQPGPRGSYDGEVAYVDHAIGELRRGIGEIAAGPVLTVLTADHAEALGEHQEDTHGYFLYDSTMLVPMIFHQLGKVRPGASAQAVRLIDIVPTVLELLGQAEMANLDGRSIVPLLNGQALPPAPAYLETRLPWVYFGWAPLKALRHDGWKMIVAPRPELYNLRQDAGEQHNRIDDQRRQTHVLLSTLRHIEAAAAVGSAKSADAETLSRLRALGYVGSGGADPEPPPNLPDPKDRIAERRVLLAAEALMGRGRFAEAVAAFDQVLAQEPENHFAMLRSGIALLKAGNLEAAAPRLQKAVLLDPSRAEARFALADALQRLGRPGDALPHWLELAQLQPRRIEAWVNLAASLAASKRPADAAGALRQAVDLEPNDARLRLTLARYQQQAGDTKAARQSVNEALAANPELRSAVAADPQLAPLLRSVDDARGI